jgi:hypothetical protein
MNVERDTSTGLNLVMVENNFEIQADAIRTGVEIMADTMAIEEAINIFVLLLLLFVSLLDYLMCIMYFIFIR